MEYLLLVQAPSHPTAEHPPNHAQSLLSRCTQK